MRTLAIIALVLLGPALMAGAPQDLGVKEQGQQMEPIVIPRSTVYNAGDSKIAVSYILVGKYKDAAGKEHEGLKASVVVFKKGSPSGSEVTFEVGAGSELVAGDERYTVVDVVKDASGDGAVKLVKK